MLSSAAVLLTVVIYAIPPFQMGFMMNKPHKSSLLKELDPLHPI